MVKNMPKITLKRVTSKNFDQVVRLTNTLTEAQKKCVAPNIASLAQAYVNKKRAWPRAIYLDHKPIGFVMLALWDDDIPKEDLPAYFLWRLMIEKDEQQKGYGSKALDIIKEKCLKDQVKTLYTSCDMKGDQPYQFYINYGFIDTGITDDDEQILKMYL